MAKGKRSPKHERFCQAVSEGMTGAEAYLWAGYKASSANARAAASRLLAKANIEKRIEELSEKRREIDAKATQIAIDKLAITKERILSELAKIGFADIRKAVKWHGTLIKEEDNAEGGDTLVIKNTYSNHVSLISSEEIDDETAGAIAEISQSPTGGLKIKLHDKRAALVDMGKHLGMFVDTHKHIGDPDNPLVTRVEHVIVDPKQG